MMLHRSAFLALACLAAVTNGKSSQSGDGGGGGSEGSCPDGGVTFDEYLRTGYCYSNADCNIEYENRNEVPPPNTTCCVSYSYPYCGIPTGCNQYLKCINDTNTAVPVPLGALDEANFTAAFEALDDCDAEPGTEEFRTCVADLMKAKMAATTMGATSAGYVAATCTSALVAIASFGTFLMN